MDNNIYSKVSYRDISVGTIGTGSTDEFSNPNDPNNLNNACWRNPTRYQWLSPGSWFNNRFFSGIYHSLRNQSYEVYVMYALLVVITVVLIAMSIDSIYHHDRIDTNLIRAERIRV